MTHPDLIAHEALKAESRTAYLAWKQAVDRVQATLTDEREVTERLNEVRLRIAMTIDCPAARHIELCSAQKGEECSVPGGYHLQRFVVAYKILEESDG